MSFKIIHNGTKINVDLPSTIPTDPKAFISDSTVLGLKAGRLVTINSAGLILALNGSAGRNSTLGVLVTDVAGGFFENIPAAGSRKAAVLLGKAVYVTDQYKSGETYAKGDLLYLGSGTDVGLITKVAPTAGANVSIEPVGVALSAATASSPELTVLLF